MLTALSILEASCIILYLASIPFAYAAEFAWKQRKFPTLAERDYYKDKMSSLLGSVYGPIGLLVIYQNYGRKYGLKWK